LSRKFKSLICLFIFLIALLPIRVEAAETSNVKDYLNYLSETEVQEFQSMIDEIANEYNLDTVVVITDKTDGKSSMEYADDFYDYNNYGLDTKKSGILMLINMDAREVWISTKGEAIIIFTDSTIKTMVNDITRNLSNKDYYGASSKFLENVDYYCDKKLMTDNIDSNSTENVPTELSPDSVVNSGSESSSDSILNSDTEVNPDLTVDSDSVGGLDSTTDSSTEVNSAPTSYSSRLKNLVTSSTTYVLSLIVSIVVTLIVTQKSKWKVTVNSRTYEGHGSFNLTNKQDILVSENTTRTKIEKKSNESNTSKKTTRSTSVGSARKASTTHKSNSGSTHGGGGGSF